MNNKNSTGRVISDASHEDLREVSAAIDGMCRYSPII